MSEPDLPDSNPQNPTGNTASSFEQNTIDNTRLMSEAFLSTQLSLGTMSSQRTPSQARSRRGDVQPSNRLERYLVSDIQRTTDQPSDAIRTDPVDQPAQQVIWGTTVNIEDSMTLFRDFITNFMVDNEPYYNPLLEYMNQNEIYDLNLDCGKLSSFEPSKKLYTQLVEYPQEIIPLMDHVLTDIFLERFEASGLPPGQSLKVRPFNLPRAVNLRELNPEDIDQLITIKGLMIRTSPVIPDMKQAFFRCSVCDYTIEIENDRGRIMEPTVCNNNNCKSSNSMQIVHNRCVFSDKQLCRLQETPDETPDGQTPYTVTLCCYDDLVDVTKPGDRVDVTGIFRAVSVRPNPRQRGINSLFKTYVDVVHIKRTSKARIGVDSSIVNENEYIVSFQEGDTIEQQTVENEQELIELSKRDNFYEYLAQSVAPSIFGMDDVKKGVLLQLFGGSHKFSSDKPGSPRIRGDLNILLVGDPGVSKSQLLQYVHKLAPRGVYTSGKGSSAVGLTAYVTRDPDTRQLVLESGALVLSDGGICCIDEFDKMSEFTRSVLHEVMEQQTISVAKAGIITTLNARTSILACANPINSKFDINMSVPENVNLAPPLLSRFDLLYLILDKPDEKDDRRLAQHLVSLYLNDRQGQVDESFLPMEKFVRYLNYAKKISPVITEEAGKVLVNYYVSMRKLGTVGGANVITFTTRQLESMIRLAEAHAKMRLSPNVEVQDVEEAHRLILSALQASAVDPKTGRIDLDLVTTGISARSRIEHEQKRHAVKQIIQSIDKTSIRWVEIYRGFQDQSDAAMSETEFMNILNELVDEGMIHITGRTNAERVIRKTR